MKVGKHEGSCNGRAVAPGNAATRNGASDSGIGNRVSNRTGLARVHDASEGNSTAAGNSVLIETRKEMLAVHAELRTLTTAILAISGGRSLSVTRSAGAGSWARPSLIEPSVSSSVTANKTELDADEDASEPHAAGGAGTEASIQSCNASPAVAANSSPIPIVGFLSSTVAHMLNDRDHNAPDAVMAIPVRSNRQSTASPLPSAPVRPCSISNHEVVADGHRDPALPCRTLWLEALRLAHASSTAASSTVAAVAEAVAAQSTVGQPIDPDDIQVNSEKEDDSGASGPCKEGKGQNAAIQREDQQLPVPHCRVS